MRCIANGFEQRAESCNANALKLAGKLPRVSLFFMDAVDSTGCALMDAAAAAERAAKACWNGNAEATQILCPSAPLSFIKPQQWLSKPSRLMNPSQIHSTIRRRDEVA